MSPEAKCEECGKKNVFHEDEVDGLLDGGELICTDCILERGYNQFLAEVLAGEHKELIQELRARLEEEEE